MAFLTLAHTTTDALTSILSALLPILQDRFGFNETGLALLVATLWFSTSVTQPLFGALADRFGGRRVAATGMLLSVSLLSLVAVMPSGALLYVLLLVGGLGSAAFHPAATAIARAAVGRNAGLAVSLFSAGGTAGLALGPVIVLVAVSSFGLAATPWLMVPGVVLAALFYVVVPFEGSESSVVRGKVFDARLVTGPIGMLTLATVMLSIPAATFTSAVPLWLVTEQGVARDAALIGWTLAAYNVSAATGGVIAGALSAHVSRHLLVAGAMLAAVAPLFAVFSLTPGTGSFFLAVMLAGGLIHAGPPVLIVSAQDLAPQAVATASGMLAGFAAGMGGVLYVGVGRLQESIGLVPAMSLSYLVLIPGAILAMAVLAKHRMELGARDRYPPACMCPPPCSCAACPRLLAA